MDQFYEDARSNEAALSIVRADDLHAALSVGRQAFEDLIDRLSK